jgi:hypothetical protein
MGRDRAAYMREYRARKRRTVDDIVVLDRLRIEQLEEEVRHLKAELAKRQPTHELDALTSLPEPATLTPPGRFNTRPFTPVPKRRG